MIKNLVSNNYYYQDALGSTTHLANNSGNLVEWYRYDLQGTPTVYAPNGSVRTGGSNYSVRHLFAGQQWYAEIGLYDLRNRYYSPDIGRFLQADPIGFDGDQGNLYRYCENNPVSHTDAAGLDVTLNFHWTGAHSIWGVTDPAGASSSGQKYFDYFGLPSALTGPSGNWYTIWQDLPSYTSTLLTFPLTPAQDLVARTALDIASDSSGRDYFNIVTDNCTFKVRSVLFNALGSLGNPINPVNPDTGNIFDAQGNWVGWENFDSGNIYDSEGDWAGWDSNWNNGSGDSGTVNYGGALPPPGDLEVPSEPSLWGHRPAPILHQ